jgi:DNA polymerase (family X)
MMTNDEIAEQLSFTAKLMELHQENPFKIKSIANAAFRIEKLSEQLSAMPAGEYEKIDGIGKSISQKIISLFETGTTSELEELKKKTPEGILKMLNIKGLGPKKIHQLWTELGIESEGELLYACYENRLITLKGFGLKTQQSIIQTLEFRKLNQDKLLFSEAEIMANDFIARVMHEHSGLKVEAVGALLRKMEVLDEIELLVTGDTTNLKNDSKYIKIIQNKDENEVISTFLHTGPKEHIEQLIHRGLNINNTFHSEQEIYASIGLSYIPAVYRDHPDAISLASENQLPDLINHQDIRGVFHAHSVYSDGAHSLEEMAKACMEKGWEYFGISDHSQSAFYAGGLKPEAIAKQHEEIEKLNKKLAPFRIFKGIESDILNNGNLDYDNEVLSSFDFVIASVHSVLNMDETRATERLIRAIENPYTTMLGHMTGRLLLSRKGYPVNVDRIIDACAANQVIIELNAHPYRLDIDWRYIRKATEKGVMISINPDAHSMSGLQDVRYGILAAQKGLLDKTFLFNAKPLSEVETYLNN